MKIAVLAGGLSPEREVSLCSGTLIANALIERGHLVRLVDVYRGISHLPENPEELFSNQPLPKHQISTRVPDLAALERECGNGKALLGPNVIELCRRADVAFLALHGAMGENGQLQAVLDVFGIPYTGSGCVGSMLAMDKDLSKRLFCGAGVPTPKWIAVRKGQVDIAKILQTVGLPAVVKPSGCGSSVGISMADTEEELERALTEAFVWGDTVLVEEKIVGREFTVGILDGRVLPPVEIVPDVGFYDYENKYKGNTKEICPAQISEEITEKLSTYVKIAFEVLRLQDYARFDFLMDAEENLYCLEANTLPGMTPTSLLPAEARAVGISYPDLCEKIATLKNKKETP